MLDRCMQLFILCCHVSAQVLPILPKPDGPLSSVVPSSSIAAANKEVKQVLDYPENGKKNTKSKIKAQRVTYEHFSPEEKAQIAEYGITASIRYFSEVFPDRLLREVLFERGNEVLT